MNNIQCFSVVKFRRMILFQEIIIPRFYRYHYHRHPQHYHLFHNDDNYLDRIYFSEFSALKRLPSPTSFLNQSSVFVCNLLNYFLLPLHKLSDENGRGFQSLASTAWHTARSLRLFTVTIKGMTTGMNDCKRPNRYNDAEEEEKTEEGDDSKDNICKMDWQQKKKKKRKTGEATSR